VLRYLIAPSSRDSLPALPRHAGNRSHSDRSRHPEDIEDKRSIECGVRQKEHLTNIFGTDDNRGRAAITLHTNLATSRRYGDDLLALRGRTLGLRGIIGISLTVPHASHRGALSNAKVIPPGFPKGFTPEPQ